MLITAHIAHGEGRDFRQRHEHSLASAGVYLVEALGAALDSIAVGVIIVSDDAHILHANQVARDMLEAGSPIVSRGGRVSAHSPDATKELRKAVAEALADTRRIGAAGIGVPLVDKDMTAAAAHVLPLEHGDLPMAAIFVTPTEKSLPVEIGTVARIYGLTPAEIRLLQRLLAGASLLEAAAALGVTEATARTHRNHIFMKTGVSRRTDLVALIARLVPPVRRVQSA